MYQNSNMYHFYHVTRHQLRGAEPGGGDLLLLHPRPQVQSQHEAGPGDIRPAVTATVYLEIINIQHRFEVVVSYNS